MRLVFFYRCIADKPYVIMNVKMKQRTRFSSGARNNQIIEGIMLMMDEQKSGVDLCTNNSNKK